MNPPLDENLFWESQVATRLGISRTAMRELRKAHLAPETDWQFRNNAVVLTPSGLQKIELRLAATPGGTSTPPEAPSPATSPRAPAACPPGPPPSARFIVWRVPPHRLDQRQRHVIIARECLPSTQPVQSWLLHTLPGLGIERPIRVRDNTNFVPGMILEAVNIGHGCWQYVGRMPRRQGRW